MRSGITDWLAGWVEWEALGGGAERMLNAAWEQEIGLWRVQRRDIALRACCRARQYKRLRRPARRSGMRMRVVRRHGLPFYLHRYRARAGIAVGAVLCALLLWQLSGRIWMIGVDGAADPRAVTQALEPLGIAVGQPLPRGGLESLRLQALENLPQAAFLSINLSGCRVQVSVREKEPVVPAPLSAPANLIAARDGVVRRVLASAGEAQVAPGDAVAAGELLVSGVWEESTGTRLLRAQGEVWAETARRYRFVVPLTETVTVPEGETVFLPRLRLFGWEIPLYDSRLLPSAECLRQQTERSLRVGERVLPLGFSCVRLQQPVQRTVRRTGEQAQEEARRQWSQQCAQLQQEQVTVLRADKREEQTADSYTLTVECVCLENIAVYENLLRTFVEK